MQQARIFESLLSATVDFVYMFDLQGRFVFANKALLDLWGMELEQAVGKTFFELPYPEALAATLQRQIVQVISTGQPLRDETAYQSPAGVHGYFEYIFSPIFADDGSVELVAGTTRDVTARKHTERALVDAQRQLDVALRAGEIATWLLDLETGQVSGDANLSRFFNIAPGAESYPLEQYLRAVHPADLPGLRAAIERSVAHGDNFEAEYRVHSADSERWVVARGLVDRDHTGRALRLAGAVLDITRRKRAEDAQRHSEERYRELFGSIDQGFCVIELRFDQQGRPHDYIFIEANPAFARQTGLADTVGRSIHALIPDVEQRWLDLHAKVVTSGEPLFIQEPLPGLERWFDVEAFRVGGPDSHKVAILCKDVTRSKLAEQSLRESEARFRNLSDHAPVMIWITNAAGRCEYVNKIWCEFTGQSEREALDLGWLQAIHPDQGQASWQAFQRANATHSPMQIEYQLRRHDGEYRTMMIAATPRFGDDRAFLGYIGSVVDISDQRRAMDSAEHLLQSERHARAEAERSSRIKDEFLATLSHELRTPLNAILGWAQITKRRAANPDEVARGLEVIERNARAQTQIIEDLLEMSSIISGKVRLRLARLDLPTLLRAALETSKPTAEAKGVQLTLSLPEPCGALVRGDASRLQQVLWNLLSNAVKFTPRGGHVELALRELDGVVELRVQDSGEGIAPEFLPYVFDRFRQADASTTRRHGGLGLGLSIVKQLSELHGGTVRVDSAGLGAGTTFTVSLPVATEISERELEQEDERARLASEPPRDLDLVELPGLRVLVLDDEIDARLLVQRLLQDCGAMATVVGSAQEALELLSGGNFDALVSDIGMPGEDGYALIQRVRALPPERGGRLPAIAVTAYAREEDRSRALQAGFSAHLTKPLQPADLVHELAVLTGRLRETRIPR